MIAFPSVDDCQRVQSAWFREVAATSGGASWNDAGLEWVAMPADRSLMLIFPGHLDGAAVERGVDYAAARGWIIGAWLPLEMEAGALIDYGFTRGWEPWWMGIDLEHVGAHSDPRVRREVLTDYSSDASAAGKLVLARESPDSAWHAVAREGGEIVGHAWSHRSRPGTVAGIFDMAVWGRRRTGLGSALLAEVGGAARTGGATHAVLNATPLGEKLYSARGFIRIGTGITWWRHPQT